MGQRGVVAACAAVALGTAVPAAAQAARSSAPLDIRAASASHAPPLPAPMRDARRRLARDLGRQAVVDVDPATGTPRALGRLDGALSPPRSGDARAIGLAYVREHAAALGLDAADLATLTPADRSTSPDGITQVRWAQRYRGIPAYDNDLRVAVDRHGRVITVQGSPRRDLRVASVVPALGKAEALRALTGDGAATFSTGDTASLVIFGTPGGSRLAWHITFRASSRVWYDAVVDASSGRVLRRSNLVKDLSSASVWEQYPGAAQGGAQTTHDITGFITGAAPTTLTGPNAHAFSDTNDDDVAQPGEEIQPNGTDFAFPFVDFTASNPGGQCLATAKCSWRNTVASSWTQNRKQNAAQAFYYVNRYHDHLAAPPIGFDAASGAFEGADRLTLQTDDGAALNAGLPDAAHVDNANMATPPDGQSPKMQMYLFFNAFGSPFRDINGGDDAAIVYHEYTHGLTNRLVTDAQGAGALNSPEAGALGEAFSDWFAKDFIVSNFPSLDTAAPGDVEMGAYTDASSGQIRTQGLDCPAGSGGAACPGAGSAGSGGYTLGDFGRIKDRPEVHADGEIWAETLWDIRTAIGSAEAERLITGGLRLAPPEPSFLDMRNAILQADTATGGTFHGTLWSIFAARGMGFFAGAADGDDVQPVQDFALPPPAGGPTGTISGRVTDSVTGLGVRGATVGIAGHATDPTFADTFAATTGADGGFALTGMPTGSYPKLVVAGAGYDSQARAPLQVGAGATTSVDFSLRRDWAGTAGGATVGSTNDNSGASAGCGVLAAVDQSPGVGWSAVNTPGSRDAFVVIALPAAIDVTAFGLDPGETCGDGPSSTTREFTVETSSDGANFSTAVDGRAGSGIPFQASEAHQLTTRAPAAGTGAGVRFVRLTLISAQNEGGGASGNQFVDFSELEVFGAGPNQPPGGTLAAAPAIVAAGSAVHLDASGVTDPDSAITAYEWDFNGDGATDQTTAGPAVDHVYPAVGAFHARVRALDFRGGSGDAATTVTVTPAAKKGPARPALRLTLPRTGRRSALVAQVACTARCTVTGRLTVTRATARRLGLGRRTTLGTARAKLAAGGHRALTIRLAKAVRSTLTRNRVRSVRGTASVSARDSHGRKASVRRAVTIRL